MGVNINVINQKMFQSPNSIVSGTQEFVKFKFNLDKEWDGLTVFAQFVQDETAYNKYLDYDDSVYLPAEIEAGKFTLMLYGTGGTTRATTNYLTFEVGQDIFVPDAQSTEITSSLYEQLVDKVDAIAEADPHLPYVNTTGHLMLWDSNLESYEDSGIGAGGGSGDTDDYDDLSNKPQIEGVELSGNKTAEDLGLAKESDIPVNTSDLVNDGDGTSAFITSDDISGIENALEQIAENTENISNLDTAVSEIETLIPLQASTQNQLADKNFTNSSIATNTAYYISNNGQPFASYAALLAYQGTVTNNDYAFVVGEDADGNTIYTRYKYNSTSSSWASEYVLNNSSFTAEQWASIQSGITTNLVSNYSTHLTNQQNPHNVSYGQLLGTPPSYTQDEVTDGTTYKRVSQTEKNTWNHSVLYTSMSLTESQKTQARSNIGVPASSNTDAKGEITTDVITSGTTTSAQMKIRITNDSSDVGRNGYITLIISNPTV